MVFLGLNVGEIKRRLLTFTMNLSRLLVALLRELQILKSRGVSLRLTRLTTSGVAWLVIVVLLILAVVVVVHE